MRLRDVAGVVQGHQASGDVRPHFHACLTQAQRWSSLQEAGEAILRGGRAHGCIKD